MKEDGTEQNTVGTEGKKIVFIMPHPPMEGFEKKFFLYDLQDAGFFTEYWDVGSILGYKMEHVVNFIGLRYIKISSHINLREEILNTNSRNCVYVLQITSSFESLLIYFLFSFYKKRTIIFWRGFLPSFERSDKNFSYYIDSLLRISNIKRFFLAKMHSVIYSSIPVFKKYDLAFVAGKAAEIAHSDGAENISRIHHFDVDLANSGTCFKGNLPDDYCVFLDDYLPHHPDFGMDAGATLNPEKYYRGINNFFDLVEESCSTSIVIAAHPKASYQVNPFCGRKILFGETDSLTKKAKVVFAHASTAVSFAVIYKKPICLIYNNDFRLIHLHLYGLMLKTSEILGCPIIDFDMDNDICFSDIDVDVDKYNSYFVDFLSSCDDDFISSQKVVEEINNLIGD